MRIKHYIATFVLSAWLGTTLALGGFVARGQDAPDFGANPPPTPTSSQPNESPNSAGTPLLCRADRDWDVFIANTLSTDEFAEYWKDILVRYYGNFCVYQDVRNIQQRLISVRQQLRSAFFACADTNALMQQYYQLEVEIYFLRKYVEVGNGQVITLDNPDSQQRLYMQMWDFFVRDREWFTQDEFRALFDQLVARYDGKLETYKQCKDPSWQELQDKFNEFRDFFNKDNPIIKQSKESLNQNWNRMAETSLNLNRDFIGGYLGVGINGIPAGKSLDETIENLEEGFAQIGEEFRDNIPTVPTFESIDRARLNSARVTERNTLAVEYLTQYQSLYKESSDVFTKGMVNSLDTLNLIIKDSYQYQNQTIQCVKSIKDKQCP